MNKKQKETSALLTSGREESCVGGKFEQLQPNDLVKDPRYAVQVSRFGMDRGPITRENAELAAFEDNTHCLQVMTLLKKMLNGGTINRDMYEAGTHFQSLFEIVRYDRYNTVRFDSVGRGRGGPEEQMARTADARNEISEYATLLGASSETIYWKAAYWVLGLGYSLNEMAKDEDKHCLAGQTTNQYWKSALVCALQILTIHHEKIKNGGYRPQKYREDNKYQMKAVDR